MPFSDPNHPLWKPENLRRAIHAAGVALWSWNVTNDRFAMDEQASKLWGLEKSGEVKFEDLSAHIHPADRDRVRAAFTATRGIVGSYEIDFRIMAGNEIRWISARGLGDDAALHEGQMFGVFLDVTGRKQAEEGNELLAGEMSHRVKNLLAIAMGLTNITSQSTTTAKEMAKELTARLAALGRAHDLVRPIPGAQGHAALLGDLLSVLLAPYEDLGAFKGRIRVAVPRMGVGEAAATALSLIFHEFGDKFGEVRSVIRGNRHTRSLGLHKRRRGDIDLDRARWAGGRTAEWRGGLRKQVAKPQCVRATRRDDQL